MEHIEYDGITIVEPSGDHDALMIDIDESVAAMRRRLAGNKGLVGGTSSKDTVSVYRVPHSLVDIHPSAIQPELVSIGPLHQAEGKSLECEGHKWWFLDGLLLRESQRRGPGLRGCFETMKQLEDRTRGCYDEDIPMSSSDFVQMILLDGCFIIELFRHVCRNDDVIGKNDPISSMPWLIPILTRDLLKLENQLPFFVLERLFDLTRTPGFGDPLPLLALKFFNLSFPRPIQVLKETSGDSEAGVSHLLSLFHLSFFYTVYTPSEREVLLEHSIQCTTQLRLSGIKFKPQKSDSFLEIKFKNRVLQVPPITINDLTIAVLINCMALEQCKYSIPNYFTSYIAFMSCLINSPRDVGFLCADGIITSYSHNDYYIAGLFNKLGEKVYLEKSDCYLSQQFRDVEAYYSSHWGTLMRTYFSTPWSFISVVTAVFLLVLTGGQTVMPILSYINKRS
ncbi:hypothetical protein ACLB2K_065815 [Fragaria x ananassa]